MAQTFDIKEGDKYKIKSGIVFIVDLITPDPKWGQMVHTSYEGGKKGNYRDTLADFIEFLTEYQAVKL